MDSDVVLQTDRKTLTQPRPITGRELMAPPKFANACAACHLLTLTPVLMKACRTISRK